MPKHLEFELARLRSHAPEGPEWLHEVKFDGYRIACRIERGKAVLFTRTQLDWTSRFPEIVAELRSLSVESAWLDGEVVAFRKSGVSDFQRLQNAFRRQTTGELMYCVFDMLYLNGYDLREAKLSQRKRLLREVLSEKAHHHIQYVDHVEGHGPEFFKQACRLGLEGAICKRAEQPYRAGRGDDWIKVKCKRREDFVIGGYTDPKSRRRGFGALLLGRFGNDEKLHFQGRVGTGFSARVERELLDRFRGLRTSASPFQAPLPMQSAGRMHWVRPELVANVEFTERTDDGFLRHPSFQGLREDVPAPSVDWKEIQDESKKAALQERREAFDIRKKSKRSAHFHSGR